MADAERVVVAVSSGSTCKDAVRWAMANKIRKPEDTLVFLHVVSKIPSPMGVDMYQSEVNNTMFVHYVRTVVQPMMLQLKKMVDSKVKLELKVARSNAVDKGILDEAKKLNATTLCLGTSAKASAPGGRRGMATTTGAFCVKSKPPGLAVFVIQRDRVLMSSESMNMAMSMSPESSANSSPAGSGRIGGANSGKVGREPSVQGNGSGDISESHGSIRSNNSGEVVDSDVPMRTPSGNLIYSSATSANSQKPEAVFQQQAALLTTSATYSAATAAQNISPAALRLMNSRASKYGSWADGFPTQAPVAPPVPEPNLTPAEHARIHWTGAGPSAAPRPVGSAFIEPDDKGKAAPESTAVVSDIDKWAKEIQERHHTTYMKDLEGRLSHARAALASFPTFIQDAVSELEKEEGAAVKPPQQSYQSQAPPQQVLLHHQQQQQQQQQQKQKPSTYASLNQPAPSFKTREPVYVSMDDTDLSVDTIMAATSTGIEGALLRELANMRRKAAEAEAARMNAELRAEQLMAAANLSLREVEAQSKRRDMENAALIQRVSREALMAKVSEEEARQMAMLEAHRKEIALNQAAMSITALENEARRRQEVEEQTRKEMAIRSIRHYQQYTWAETCAATEDWKPERKIGEGGFGTVYKGTLHHTPVAIKVLKNTNALQAASEFQQEVEVLGQIQHPHIVMLLGCCPEKYALVYEFMANGSLEDRLACRSGTPPIPWFVRLRIIAEVASALLALHTRPVPIVHRDLKPANILLAKNYVAKLGDVGLARLMPELNDNRTYMRDSTPVGTFAYVDPEFQRTGEYGPKSDVYALGIVLLDLLTGRKPSVYEHLEESVDDRDMDKFISFLDPTAGNWPLELSMEVAIMAVRCSEMRRRKRPDLERDVMPILNKACEAALKAEEEEMHQRRRPVFGDAPTSLYCPITQEIMVNPVLASDGHTYELLAIQQWLETNDRSPMTNAKLPNKDLVPNHAVRSMIREWQERNGRF